MYVEKGAESSSYPLAAGHWRPAACIRVGGSHSAASYRASRSPAQNQTVCSESFPSECRGRSDLNRVLPSKKLAVHPLLIPKPSFYPAGRRLVQ